MERTVEARLEHDLVAPLFHRVLLTIVVGALLIAIVSVIGGVMRIVPWALGNALVAAILIRVVRRGHLRAGSLVQCLILVATTIYTLTSGYGLLDVSMLILPVLFLLISVLLSARWMFTVVLITDCTVVAVGVAEMRGWLVTPNSALVMYDDIADAVVMLTTMGAFVQFLVATMRRAIVEARLAHKKTRDILDATNEAIFIHDAKDGKILEVNEPTLQMFACSRSELIEQTSRDSSNEGALDYTAQSTEYVKRAISEGPQSFEWQARPRAGSSFWVEVGLRSADIADEPRVVAVARDITARRRLEQRVREAETFRAVGQLAGGVAHDFNNQLVGILGNAQFLRDAVAGDAELRNCADSILASGHRAADLTQQLLAFARRGRVRSLPVDLHQLIAEVIALGRRSIDKRIAIEQRLDANHAVTIGDPSALQNALLNLLLNARDAMPQGGTVRFVTCNIDIVDGAPRENKLALPPGQYIEITVEDTGVGIPPEVIAKVFEPFFTTKDSGTGMGLAAVQGTALEHQGTVTVISDPGCGSTFRLLLPINGSSKMIQTVRTEESTQLATHSRVLVVDDEPSVLSIVRRTLEWGGYDVASCSGGLQALECYRQNRFDLVLLDIMMPDLDGVEVLRRIRTINPEAKVMLMTGHTEESVRARLREFPDVNVVLKPFLPKELLAEIRKLPLHASRHPQAHLSSR